MPRVYPKELCPKCKEREKQVRSKMCVRCSRREFAQGNRKHMGTLRSKGGYRPAGYITIEKDEVDLIRPLQGYEGKPSWRPPHYPPPCEVCNGFAYLPSDGGHTACSGCKDHPGHAMSFAEWDRVRP